MLMTGLIALFALFLGLTIGSCCGYGLGYSERAKRGREMWKNFHAGRRNGLAEEPQELVVYHYHQHGGLIKEEKTITSKHTRLNVDGTANQRWEPTPGEKIHAEAQANGLVKEDALCQGAAEYQAANPSKTFTQAALKILEGSRDERLMSPTADALGRHEAEHGTPGWSTPIERGAGLLRNGAPSKT